MNQPLRKSGVFFGSIFLCGAVLVMVLYMAVDGWSLLEAFKRSAITFAVALLFFASAYRSAAAWIQPIIFLIVTPYSISTDDTSFYGLGFFACALILLYRLGFYEKRRILKVVLSFAYFTLAEAAGVIFTGQKLVYAIGAVFFMLVFGIFIYLVFEEKLAVFLKEPKRELSLTDKRLTATERTYTLACIAGKSTKEVAFDFGVSESTVRNTLARSYRKLGVGDKAGLAALAEKYRLID